MTRRAVFLDLDGTYADGRGLVPDSARRAVVDARANGNLVFLCTGRARPMISEHVLEAGFDGLITSAGGYVEVDGETLLHRSVPLQDLDDVISFLDEHRIAYYLEGNDGLYTTPVTRDLMRAGLFAGVTDPQVIAQLQKGIGWIIDEMVVDQDLRREGINTINILGSDTPLDVYRERFGDRLTVNESSVRQFGPNSAEVTPKGLSKATAIDLVCQHFGVPWEDTVGYGDAANDLEMIRHVHTGVAMGNAVDEVKAAAGHVTGAPEGGGLAASFADLGLT